MYTLFYTLYICMYVCVWSINNIYIFKKVLFYYLNYYTLKFSLIYYFTTFTTLVILNTHTYIYV